MIIGVNGLKGAGKSTVAEYICSKWGFEHASFAAKLKESAAALFGIDPYDWEEMKNDETATVTLAWTRNKVQIPMSVRQFLQRYGTESHRDVFGVDFWVEQGMKGLTYKSDVVFADARFQNELATIRYKKGMNIEVVRHNTDTNDTHASEKPAPPELIDHVVYNYEDFDWLYYQVDQIMDQYGYTA